MQQTLFRTKKTSFNRGIHRRQKHRDYNHYSLLHSSTNSLQSCAWSHTSGHEQHPEIDLLTKSTRVLCSHKWLFVFPFVQTVSDNSSTTEKSTYPRSAVFSEAAELETNEPKFKFDPVSLTTCWSSVSFGLYTNLTSDQVARVTWSQSVPFVFEDFDFTVLCFCCSGEHTYSMTRFTRSSLTCVLLVCFFAKKRDLFYFTRVLLF